MKVETEKKGINKQLMKKEEKFFSLKMNGNVQKFVAEIKLKR